MEYKPIIVNSFFQISRPSSNWINWNKNDNVDNYQVKFSSKYNAAYINHGGEGGADAYGRRGYYDVWLRIKLDQSNNFSRGIVSNFKIALPVSSGDTASRDIYAFIVKDSSLCYQTNSEGQAPLTLDQLLNDKTNVIAYEFVQNVGNNSNCIFEFNNFEAESNYIDIVFKSNELYTTISGEDNKTKFFEIAYGKDNYNNGPVNLLTNYTVEYYDGEELLESFTTSSSNEAIIIKDKVEKSGYHFVSWTDNAGNSYQPGESKVFGTKTELHARMAIKQFQINFSLTYIDNTSSSEINIGNYIQINGEAIQNNSYTINQKDEITLLLTNILNEGNYKNYTLSTESLSLTYPNNNGSWSLIEQLEENGNKTLYYRYTAMENITLYPLTYKIKFVQVDGSLIEEYVNVSNKELFSSEILFKKNTDDTGWSSLTVNSLQQQKQPIFQDYTIITVYYSLAKNYEDNESKPTYVYNDYEITVGNVNSLGQIIFLPDYTNYYFDGGNLYPGSKFSFTLDGESYNETILWPFGQKTTIYCSFIPNSKIPQIKLIPTDNGTIDFKLSGGGYVLYKIDNPQFPIIKEVQ